MQWRSNGVALAVKQGGMRLRSQAGEANLSYAKLTGASLSGAVGINFCLKSDLPPTPQAEVAGLKEKQP